MIPEEVAIIAKEIAKFNDEEDYSRYIHLAWNIYNKLQICQCP